MWCVRERRFVWYTYYILWLNARSMSDTNRADPLATRQLGTGQKLDTTSTLRLLSALCFVGAIVARVVGGLSQ